MVFRKTKFAIVLLSIVAFSAMIQTGSCLIAPKKSFNRNGGLGAYEPTYYEKLGNNTKEFLRGAKVTSRIPTTEECIIDVMRVYKTMWEDYEEIQRKVERDGFNFERYLDYTITIGKAQPTIKICFDSHYQFYEETDQWVNHFSGPLSFAWKFALNQVYSGYRWFEIAKALNYAYAKQNMTRMSYVAGTAAYVLVDFDEELKTPLNQDLSLKSFGTNFFVGIFDLAYNFLDGAKIFETTTVAKCENGIKDYKNTFREAIAEIKKNTYESWKTGIFQLADMLADLHSVNEKCVSGIEAGISRVEEYKKMRKAPMEVLRNFVWNHRKIYKHMMQTVECLFNLDSKCIGFSSGQLFFEIFAKH